MLAVALAAAGCGERAPEGGDTSVLGGYAPQADRASGLPTLSDADGQVIPVPPAPAGSRPQMARSGDGTAVAVWLQDEQVVASTWTRNGGWSEAQPLERIYGESSDPQLVSNGRGVAMAVWHHRVGNIHSLRFSRHAAASGWSLPDVLPGALPRPPVAGTPPGQDAPRLEMDVEGNVVARWNSGFQANEMQVARYTEGQGWSEAASEPVAAAPSAAPPAR